jgi:hypothetical protein
VERDARGLSSTREEAVFDAVGIEFIGLRRGPREAPFQEYAFTQGRVIRWTRAAGGWRRATVSDADRRQPVGVEEIVLAAIELAACPIGGYEVIDANGALRGARIRRLGDAWLVVPAGVFHANEFMLDYGSVGERVFLRSTFPHWAVRRESSATRVTVLESVSESPITAITESPQPAILPPAAIVTNASPLALEPGRELPGVLNTGAGPVGGLYALTPSTSGAQWTLRINTEARLDVWISSGGRWLDHIAIAGVATEHTHCATAGEPTYVLVANLNQGAPVDYTIEASRTALTRTYRLRATPVTQHVEFTPRVCPGLGGQREDTVSLSSFVVAGWVVAQLTGLTPATIRFSGDAPQHQNDRQLAALVDPGDSIRVVTTFNGVPNRANAGLDVQLIPTTVVTPSTQQVQLTRLGMGNAYLGSLCISGNVAAGTRLSLRIPGGVGRIYRLADRVITGVDSVLVDRPLVIDWLPMCPSRLGVQVTVPQPRADVVARLDLQTPPPVALANPSGGALATTPAPTNAPPIRMTATPALTQVELTVGARGSRAVDVHVDSAGGSVAFISSSGLDLTLLAPGGAPAPQRTTTTMVDGRLLTSFGAPVRGTYRLRVTNPANQPRAVQIRLRWVPVVR